MKTELDLRIEELEDAMQKATPGSEGYEHIVEDYTKLVKCRLDKDQQMIDHELKMRNLDLEEDKAKNTHEENMLKAEAEAKSKSVWRDVLCIGGGTLLPFGLYMLWEQSGHLVSGKAVNWIGKVFKR